MSRETFYLVALTVPKLQFGRFYCSFGSGIIYNKNISLKKLPDHFKIEPTQIKSIYGYTGVDQVYILSVQIKSNQIYIWLECSTIDRNYIHYVHSNQIK